jgi:hypothetical protein
MSKRNLVHFMVLYYLHTFIISLKMGFKEPKHVAVNYLK